MSEEMKGIPGRVSCIITTYHRAFSMVRQSLDSVLAQTYPDKEIILVSDNPPDSPWAAEVREGMRDYPDCLLVQLERNSGAQVARNTGIRRSSGEFLAFLDDDDLWLPEKLAKQIPLFDDPKVGLVYCIGYIFSGEDREHKRISHNAERGFNTHIDFQTELERDSIGTTSQAVFRRACLDKAGYFDEKLPARQDYDRWLAILKHYDGAGVAEPLYMNREHDGVQITKSGDAALFASKYLYQKYKKDFDQNKKAKMNLYYERAFLQHHFKNNGEAVKSAFRAFFTSPSLFVKRVLYGRRLAREIQARKKNA